MYDFMQANWGEHPSRTYDRTPIYAPDARVPEPWASRTGWTRLRDDERDYVTSAFAGKTLPQVLEGTVFWFTIDGCTRACTHQMVRVRIGAGFSQHGGRDNDWRHRRWTVPETVKRVIEAQNGTLGDDRLPVMGDQDTLAVKAPNIMGRIHDLRCEMQQLYADLVDIGVPFQDARRLLPMGTQTYLHAHYTYPALAGLLANRLEHVMDWEINCVAQLMFRQLHLHCPPLMTQFLGSHSDRARVAKFAGLESWPPDGKYPNPYERCAHCEHPKSNHLFGVGDDVQCESCDCASYTPCDTLPRLHSPLQNPFWVLTPDALRGGPVEWIPSNGTYPWEQINGQGQ